jgi:EAL domain-containing protein (putative c-di-GMP-specific phosphodiesterase class I)
MQDHMLERRLMATDLRQALSKGELALHFQPLVGVSDGETQGYEALLRWTHPERGSVSPDDFIPVAEETAMIVPIGEWVLRTAVAELTHWPEHLSVAVNLSPVQIRSDNLIPTVINLLASSGVNPARLELEITESVLLHDSEENVARLHQLRELGVRISLDDFGTGYSSLNYLRSFPFDKIKIDRSFVDGLSDRADCKAIVNAVVGLAAELKMTTTAEGVESIEQLDALRLNGCMQAQGYLFSKAVAATELGYSAGATDTANVTTLRHSGDDKSFDMGKAKRMRKSL